MMESHQSMLLQVEEQERALTFSKWCYNRLHYYIRVSSCPRSCSYRRNTEQLSTPAHDGVIQPLSFPR